MVQNYNGLDYEEWWMAGQPSYLLTSETSYTSFNILDGPKVQELVSSCAANASIAEHTPDFTQGCMKPLPRSSSTFPSESPHITTTSNIREIVPPEDRAGKQRGRTRERNRMAASKNRNKNREDAERLELYEERLGHIHQDLSSCVAELTIEVCKLKTMLLQHSECDCSTIQSYLVTEANRFVSQLEINKR
jgi:hypothetical protein